MLIYDNSGRKLRHRILLSFFVVETFFTLFHLSLTFFRPEFPFNNLFCTCVSKWLIEKRRTYIDTWLNLHRYMTCFQSASILRHKDFSDVCLSLLSRMTRFLISAIFKWNTHPFNFGTFPELYG